MMAQSTLSVRIDSDDKKEFDEFCKNVGLSTSGVINMFVKRVITEKKIPFDISLDNKVSSNEFWQAYLALREQIEENGLQDMTIEEIDKIIQDTRTKKKW